MSNLERLQKHASFVFALIGTGIGIFNFFETRSIDRRIKAEEHLAKAWDHLGGHPGTDMLPDMEHPSSALVLAEREIGLALILAPRMSEAHRKYCVLLRRKNKLEVAREQCQKAIDLDSRNASAYNSLGNVLKDATIYTEAVAAYERALEIDSSFPAYSNLVTTLRLQENYRKAISVARMEVAVFPDSAVAYYDLGMALLESGQREEALDEFKQVTRLEPGMQHVVDAAMAKNRGKASKAE